MAGSGRRCGILLNRRLRSCLCEILGAKTQQLSLSSTSAASQIGVAPSARVRCTAATFLSSGLSNSKGIGPSSSGAVSPGPSNSKGIGPSSSGAVWGAWDTRTKSHREFVRQASTHQPSEEAAKEEELYEAKKQQAQIEKEAAKATEEKDEEVDEKIQTLRAALAHVPKFGWTEAAIVAGARDVGLSPSIVGAFPRKEAALVEFFMDECTQALVEELESQEEELGKLVLQDRIATIVWVRLEMQIPYLPKWAQALSIQANPMNLAATIKQRALLIDEIWHSAGDRSADLDWYAKRAILTGVYSTTELYMLTDTSPGFRDSRAFLERRINDALDCRKTVQEAGHLAQAVGAGLQNTVTSFLNRTNPPSGTGF